MTNPLTADIAAATTTDTLDSLHHVAISVDNIARAVEWYRSNLRCRIAYQDETWAMLEFANTRLALVIPSQHPPHIGFETPKAEDYGELKLHRDGTRSTYAADSAGNVVEFMAPIGSP